MPPETRVLFNADCPVCNAEICHYQRYTDARALPVRYDDLNGPDRAAWGIDPDSAAQRLHVMHLGLVYSGLDAFRILWKQMPRYRWLATLTGLPGLYQIASLTYDKVLAPTLYRRHIKRIRQGEPT